MEEEKKTESQAQELKSDELKSEEIKPEENPQEANAEEGQVQAPETEKNNPVKEWFAGKAKWLKNKFHPDEATKAERKKHYISGKESRNIAKQNRKAVNDLQKKRAGFKREDYVTEMKDEKNIVEFEDLHTYFFTDNGTVKAVNGVSFEIPQGSTVGVVGESGCGKSVTSLSLMQLVQGPSGQIVSGSIRFRSTVRTHATAPKLKSKKNDDGTPVLDENGQPVLEPVLDKNGNPKTVKLYEPVVRQKTDADRAVFDENGAPVMEPVLNKHGKPKKVFGFSPLLQNKTDENGNPVIDENGEPVREPVLNEKGEPKKVFGLIPKMRQKTEKGQPMFDENGKPVMEPVLNRFGKPRMMKVYEEREEVLDIAKMPVSDMMSIRGREIAMIFQEPMTSLNPVFTIGYQLDEVSLLHINGATKETAKARSLEMLNLVGIAMPEHVYKSYPHQLSGGMRQRVMIAMALCCNPKLIIADEPTTALDVTIQAQILDLLREIKKKISGSIMLITHDLGVIAEMADYIVVMYAGRIVEMGTVQEIFKNPMHPYTIGLQKSKPVVRRKVDRLYSIPGNVPNPINMPSTCYFSDRCDKRCEKCKGDYPDMVQVSPTHKVACHLYAEKEEA